MFSNICVKERESTWPISLGYFFQRCLHRVRLLSCEPIWLILVRANLSAAVFLRFSNRIATTPVEDILNSARLHRSSRAGNSRHTHPTAGTDTFQISAPRQMVRAKILHHCHSNRPSKIAGWASARRRRQLPTRRQVTYRVSMISHASIEQRRSRWCSCQYILDILLRGTCSSANTMAPAGLSIGLRLPRTWYQPPLCRRQRGKQIHGNTSAITSIKLRQRRHQQLRTLSSVYSILSHCMHGRCAIHRHSDTPRWVYRSRIKY